MSPHFTANGVLQIVIYFAVLLACIKPLGGYMAKVYMGKPIFLEKILGPVERLLYAIAGVKPDQEMSWQKYVAAMVIFSLYLESRRAQ